MTPGLRLTLAAEIAVVQGRSLDVVVAWVKRHGLPDPGAPRWPWQEAYERIIRAYDTHLWREGEGFAIGWCYRGKGAPDVPACIRRYIAEGDNPELVASLKRKVEWCDAQPKPAEEGFQATANAFAAVMAHPERAEELGDALLKNPSEFLPLVGSRVHFEQVVAHSQPAARAASSTAAA